MLHKHTKALLLATCLVGAPSFAFAQTSQMQSNQPATQAQSPGAAKAIERAQPNQVMGSDLRGARVYSANNENIGDVNDFLMSRDGRIDALIIGVGGFLGIGEKRVALPFSAFEFVNEPVTARTTSPGEPATTGTVRSEQSPADRALADRSAAERTPTTTAAGAMKPDHLLLKNMTKADLQNAPTFQTSATSSAPAQRTTPAPDTAPRR
jgi:hypothetical protein